MWDPGEERYTLYADVQYPHRVRQALATRIFKIPESRIRVVAGDVGGGFGTKGWQYPEHRLVLFAAQKLRRPVKWACERSEAVLADEHARDNVTEAELALDNDGKFLGLRVKTLANVGAYISSERNLLATFCNVGTLTGVYDIPAAHVAVLAVMANTNGTAPYRGAGRPEATYVIERLIDDAARELRTTTRSNCAASNLIPAEAMPYKTALGLNYDCGDFPPTRRRRWRSPTGPGSPARREESTAPRQTARHRHRQPDREGGRSRPGIRRNPLPPERQRHALDGQQEPGPGPRDHVQAGAARAARPRPGRRPVHRRRHRPGRLRHRHQRLALDRDRRLGAVDGGRQDHRQGQEDRRAPAGGGRGRHRIPSPTRRQFAVAGTDRRLSI